MERAATTNITQTGHTDCAEQGDDQQERRNWLASRKWDETQRQHNLRSRKGRRAIRQYIALTAAADEMIKTNERKKRKEKGKKEK